MSGWHSGGVRAADLRAVLGRFDAADDLERGHVASLLLLLDGPCDPFSRSSTEMPSTLEQTLLAASFTLPAWIITPVRFW